MFLIQLRVLLQDNYNCLTHTPPFPSNHYTSMIRECIDSRVPMKCCKMKVTQGCIHLHTSTELCNTHGSSAVAQGTRGLKGISTPIYRFGAKSSLSLFAACKIWEEKKPHLAKFSSFPSISWDTFMCHLHKGTVFHYEQEIQTATKPSCLICRGRVNFQCENSNFSLLCL